MKKQRIRKISKIHIKITKYVRGKIQWEKGASFRQSDKGSIINRNTLV
jgi:hypothetical protein